LDFGSASSQHPPLRGIELTGPGELSYGVYKGNLLGTFHRETLVRPIERLYGLRAGGFRMTTSKDIAHFPEFD